MVWESGHHSRLECKENKIINSVSALFIIIFNYAHFYVQEIVVKEGFATYKTFLALGELNKNWKHWELMGERWEKK
jgi:hypothetical protein